jgi:hypothetical protein
MVAAQNLLNLVQSRKALGSRLPIPEHDKALSAYAAMGLGVPICFLAEYLHVDLIRAPASEGTKVTILRFSRGRNSTMAARWAAFGAESAAHFGGAPAR